MLNKTWRNIYRYTEKPKTYIIHNGQTVMDYSEQLCLVHSLKQLVSDMLHRILPVDFATLIVIPFQVSWNAVCLWRSKIL